MGRVDHIFFSSDVMTQKQLTCMQTYASTNATCMFNNGEGGFEFNTATTSTKELIYLK